MAHRIRRYSSNKISLNTVNSMAAVPAVSALLVDILAVGAGGGAGDTITGTVAVSGAGGGAVMYQSNVLLQRGQLYTATVGAGGGHGADGGTSSYANIRGANGNPTTVVGTGLNIFAVGGGGSSGRYDVVASNSGASGGGYNGARTTGIPVPYGRGIPGLGYNGGDGGTNLGTGGGGGGAGAAGGNGDGTANAGAGGDGVQNNITGTNYYWGGGGGGGMRGGSNIPYTAGNGGAGGGGGGGCCSGSAGTATPGTGGSGINPGANGVGSKTTSSTITVGGNGGQNTGGGGGGCSSTSPSGNGGSGVVIFRTSDAVPLATTTGSPTITTANGYRVYIFTGSGTITF